ncbi:MULTISPECIES: DUF960 family protein [unclassified Paenibacillus]|uniref:DUF960 family protein n=1 Tax=unclassified Paenibacillus TaxID=185978 RepID=UPI001AE2B3A2|nr:MULTISPECIES: DUF960 family protein [unclassified Paenibacillus]MBP1157689.1 hypothetical protein [Paenibacillus sp. PvP091]MBP1171574.1 hypothetical protein [Paenibacillus sp. PvR098]MBP2437955.1 hypothetical protein [Paenibacillus sp. PvP052]
MMPKFVPRGATSEAHKFLPLGLQLHLYRLIDSQIERGLEMDHWQFFELHKIDENQLRIVHSQNNPARKEDHLLEGFNISQDYIEAWIINYDDLGATLTVANPAH